MSLVDIMQSFFDKCVLASVILESCTHFFFVSCVLDWFTAKNKLKRKHDNESKKKMNAWTTATNMSISS